MGTTICRRSEASPSWPSKKSALAKSGYFSWLSEAMMPGRQALVVLSDRDIAVVVGVSGLQEGTHQVRPRLILPPQVSYSDPPPQVIVTIVEIDPTPTPESEPEPTQPEPEATGTSPP